jgi:hypothetical protein
MATSVANFSRYVCLLCFVLCLGVTALAKDGRDFAGFYAVSEISGLSDQPTDRTAKIELTLTVRVLNNSDLGDIEKPIIELLESGSHASLGEFSAVKVMPSKRDVVVTGRFTVSREEFERWSLRGGGPNVVVIYKDQAGRTLQEHVQLSRQPVIPLPAVPSE